MPARLHSAGQEVEISSERAWASRLLEEACAGELRTPGRVAPRPTLRVHIEASTAPFHGPGWEVVTRGAWRRGGEVVLTDACATGFDLALRPDGTCLWVRARWRPAARNRGAQALLRSRFHLLCRAALLQYPVLWWAGVAGLAPLHVSAVGVGDEVALLAGPGGVGKSTVVAQQVDAGAPCTSDNLCVSDGERVWGLTEPARSEHAAGRRMPHGRREGPLPGRVDRLDPTCLLVLGLADGPARLDPLPPGTAARALTTGTAMAGELRRYWPFAATLAAALDIGPAQPQVEHVAGRLATRLPCYGLRRSRGDFRTLDQLLPAREVAL